MGLLTGKNVLVTGVLTTSSIAFHTAAAAQREGAEVLLSSFGRALPITTAAAELLPRPAPVLVLDVTSVADLAALPDSLGKHIDGLDGIVHSIAFAPGNALGGAFLNTSWDEAATALQISAYSLQSLTSACLPVLRRGASIVGLDFDASMAWPGYDWMGVAKAALESITRYLAMYLGPHEIRANLVAAGMVRTLAATSIPGSERLEEIWRKRPPLSWDVHDPAPIARACVTLLSDWLNATTGEVLHVDGGLHAVID